MCSGYTCVQSGQQGMECFFGLSKIFYQKSTGAFSLNLENTKMTPLLPLLTTVVKNYREKKIEYNFKVRFKK